MDPGSTCPRSGPWIQGLLIDPVAPESLHVPRVAFLLGSPSQGMAVPATQLPKPAFWVLETPISLTLHT